MICHCGHNKADHYDRYRELGGCQRFACCTRQADLRAGHHGAEHDFADHQTSRCSCSQFVLEAAPPSTPYGLTPGIPDVDYHADREHLSSTGARKVLDCPAKFRWDMDNPRTGSTPAFDFGKVAHALVLGEGGPIQIVDADNWLTKAAKEQRAACYAAGVTAVLRAEHDDAQALRDAVMRHPTAAALFLDGHAELSGFWTDEATGVGLKFRPDWLTDLDGRPVCVDLKTTQSADPREFARSVAKWGYDLQAFWYLAGLAAHGVEDARFIFVAVEKQLPYPVSVIELDAQALENGRKKMRRAIDLYARCIESDTWPAYGAGIHTISLPQWAYRNDFAMEGI